MPSITAEGMTVVVVEQDVTTARQVSQRIYCFQEGRVSLTGRSDELTREQISQAYFGMEAAQRDPLQCASDVLVFDVDALDEPFVTCDSAMVDIMSPGLEKALAEHATTPTLAGRVSALLNREMQGQRPSIDTIAKAFFITSRTLQRRPAQEGAIYQCVLNQALQELARCPLRSTDLDAREIAFLLASRS